MSHPFPPRYARGAGGGDARRGGGIRSMRRTVGLTEVPAVLEVSRTEFMEQVKDELDAFEAVFAPGEH